ncbi:MAG TPA: NADPH-dependent F420 reductase [Methylomirabilota bacterium]|nr:NADPH-dependent F420 reductase [Methylomirabilota bacterium]
MIIAIIGSGNVGGTLGRAWAGRGHTIVFGARDPKAANLAALVTSIGERASVATVPEAVARAEVALLATPWSAAESAVRAARDWRGKILVDATNPLTADVSGLALGHTTSGGEQVAGWATGARVVKAFNTIGSMHMTGAPFGAERASMFLCGDDADAKRTVGDLARELAFDPVDAGPLRQARLLEPLAMLWISMAYAHGHGPNIALRLLRK